MRSIETPDDFSALLQAERAVVFIDFTWSAEAAEARRTVERWEQELASQTEKRDWAVHRLVPDGHPFTWKWVGAMADFDSLQNGACVVLWLKTGSVVGRAQGTAGLGSKDLVSLTRSCFRWPSASAASESSEYEISACPAELMKILCCPETHQELKPATSSLVQRANQAIAAGLLRSRNGQWVREKVEGGLVRADGQFLYPIRHNIPIMLIDESIPLAGI